MRNVTVNIDRERTRGVIDPMIFGQYLEHVQPEDRCIYGAIVDDGPPNDDDPGFREDVIEAVRELDVPIVRWPGGCHADFYHWQDGIGPRSARPVRRNWHWGGLESNQFGTDEFLQWCELIGSKPYLNVNFGTGTLDEALRWLDYCNGGEPTTDVEDRRRNGRQEPWNVATWGLGNEQWGPWEAGHLSAADYAEKLRNWAQFFRKYDDSLDLLGIGSPAARDPDWDIEVLNAAGNLIDYLTLHVYGHSFIDEPDDYDATVHFPVYMEDRVERMIGVIEAAGFGENSAHPIRISIDEWNMRHLTHNPETGGTDLHRLSPRTMQDALAVAGAFHVMARHATHVAMANYVFLLNGNGVLLVNDDGVVRTPLFHLFALYRRSLLPTVLDARVESPASDRPVREYVRRQNAQDGVVNRTVPFVDVIATTDGDRLAVGIVNRHQTEDASVEIPNVAVGGEATITTIAHRDARATNDVEHPDTITPQATTVPWTGTVTVPPQSVTMVELGSRAGQAVSGK